jgi:AraC-like DNA-binding protein
VLSSFNRSLELMDRFETDYIRLFFYDLAVNYKGTYKSYEYIRLCTIIEGEELVSVNNYDTFKYDSDRYVLLPSEFNVQVEIIQPTKAVIFELSTQLIRQVNEKVSNEYSIDYGLLSHNNYYVGYKNMKLKTILNKIIVESRKKKEDSKFLIDLYAQELVCYLIRNKDANQVLNFQTDNPINKAICYMNDNFLQSVSIKQLACNINMSEANFCQYFKRITNTTPNRYLTNIKLEKSKGLLKQASVTEVAFDLGYDNISYFISLFKKKYGITPKQYQKMK